MKKIFHLLLLCCGCMLAQEAGPDNLLAGKNNEVRVDVLSAIAFGKANISYERFIGKDWSVGLTGSFAFGKKTDEDFDEGFRNTLPNYEVIPYVRYRLSQSVKHYYFVEVFASANNGDFKEIKRVDDGSSAYYTIDEQEYNDVALGGSIGYKVYFGQPFVLEVLVGAGYNLFNTDKSPDVISRVGLNFGYRF